MYSRRSVCVFRARRHLLDEEPVHFCMTLAVRGLDLFHELLFVFEVGFHIPKQCLDQVRDFVLPCLRLFDRDDLVRHFDQRCVLLIDKSVVNRILVTPFDSHHDMYLSRKFSLSQSAIRLPVLYLAQSTAVSSVQRT